MMHQGLDLDTIITNACVVLPDRVLSKGMLGVKNGKIMDVACADTVSSGSCHPPAATKVFDFSGDVIVPGLIDLHVHGCGGADTMDADPAALGKMASSIFQQGTVAFLATTMTSTAARLQEVLTAGTGFQPMKGQAELLGFHMEGPCISIAYRGAQNMSEMSEVAVPVTGNVRILTLAPEMAAAQVYVDWAKSADIIISAGHSGATYDEMQEAIKRGVRHVTHAFNAMPGIHHRAPGLLTAALLDPGVTIELIADGVHIHPAVLELALRLKGPDKVVLVSDGTRAVGMPDGEYELGGQVVYLKQGKMTLQDGTIAGSAASLLDGLRLITKVVGRPLHEAVRMAALNPARLMKVENRLGSIEKEKEATFLRLTPDLILKEVWVRGRQVTF